MAETTEEAKADRVVASHEDWNRALTEHLLPERPAGTAACLSVDDDLLVELGGPTGRADFVACVVREWFDASGALRAREMRAALRQRRGGIDPSYVGLLGLCVLAASDMEADQTLGIADHNYYARLNGMIGRIDGGAPPGFAELDALWEDLRSWLEASPTRGASTISTHATFVHVGYPMSQALLSRRERRRLPDFFVAAGLEPGRTSEGAELLHHLRSWAKEGCRLRPLTIRRVADGTADEMLALTLESEFRAWDGTRWDPSGRCKNDIVLQLATHHGGQRCSLGFWAKRPPGSPDVLACTAFSLQAQSADWYGPIDGAAVPTGDPLRTEIAITSIDGRWAFVREVRPVIPMHKDFDLGHWVEVPRMRLYEDLALVVREDHIGPTERYLAAHGPAGKMLAPDGLPDGWALILNAKVTDASLSEEPSLRGLAQVLPRPSSGLHLRGGLRVASRPLEYLVGEEPYLDAHPLAATWLSVDGAVEEMPSAPVSLSLSYAGLVEGEHYVSLPPQGRHFWTTRGRQPTRPFGAGMIGFALDCSGPRPLVETPEPQGFPEDLPAAAVILSGGHLTVGPSANWGEGLARPVLIRRRPSVTVVGANPGEIEVLALPPRPAWLSQIHGGGAIYFEAGFSFAPCFAVHLFGDDSWAADWLGDPVPAPVGPAGCRAPEEVAAWAKVIRAVEPSAIAPQRLVVWNILLDRAAAVVA